MPCLDPPKLLADTLYFQVPVASATMLAPVQRKTSSHHFRRQITPIFKGAGGNGPFMGCAAICDSGDHLATTQVHQRTFRILPVGMVKLRRIDAREANMDLVDHYGVAIDHPAVTTNNLLPCLLFHLPQRFWWEGPDRLHWHRNGTIAISGLLITIPATLGREKFQQ